MDGRGATRQDAGRRASRVLPPRWGVPGLEATRLFLAAQAWDRAAEEGEGLVGFMQRYGRVIDLAAVTREMCEGLPEEHAAFHRFLGTEGDALAGLGLGLEALKRARQVSELLLGRLKQEPERADYLRDLSVSYERMGDLLSGLGQGEQARQFYQKALQIAERLVQQEPERADYQTDLVVSLVRIGGRANLERAVAILRRLQSENRLTHEQATQWIPALESALRSP